MEEERLVKLAGLDICDLFYPVALLFQVIYLLLQSMSSSLLLEVLEMLVMSPRGQVLRAEVSSKLLEMFKP